MNRRCTATATQVTRETQCANTPHLYRHSAFTECTVLIVWGSLLFAGDNFHLFYAHLSPRSSIIIAFCFCLIVVLLSRCLLSYTKCELFTFELLFEIRILVPLSTVLVELKSCTLSSKLCTSLCLFMLF